MYVCVYIYVHLLTLVIATNKRNVRSYYSFPVAVASVFYLPVTRGHEILLRHEFVCSRPRPHRWFSTSFAVGHHRWRLTTQPSSPFCAIQHRMVPAPCPEYAVSDPTHACQPNVRLVWVRVRCVVKYTAWIVADIRCNVPLHSTSCTGVASRLPHLTDKPTLTDFNRLVYNYLYIPFFQTRYHP